MRRGPIILTVLLVLSLMASLAAQEPGSDSPVPSITNPGPRGLAVLATWLKESGGTVISHDAPFTQLPPEARVVVIAAPVGAEIRDDEVAALKRFVEGGGTLVYLRPREAPQPAINEWLHVHAGEVAPLVNEPGLQDVSGTTVTVTFAAGLLAGAKHLRLSADRMIHLNDDDDAVPVTSDGAIWWLHRGAGEVWIAAGPDLAENARLELADNALFWAQLATRGPIIFDEFHQHLPASLVPINLVVTALQAFFLAVLFVWARAPRLGPVRDAPASWHRSSLEYVKAMGALTRNAGVEGELMQALKTDFRRFLREVASVPEAWTWEDADGELARRQSLPPGTLVTASQHTSFVALSQALAKVENDLRHG